MKEKVNIEKKNKGQFTIFNGRYKNIKKFFFWKIYNI